MKTTKKGLLVSVLRNAEVSDCTNGGVTATATSAILVGDGVAEIFEPDGKRPTLKLVKRFLFGRDYYHAEPIDAPKFGAQFGGNFIHSCDSRFSAITGDGYPIPVHDRFER